MTALREWWHRLTCRPAPPGDSTAWQCPRCGRRYVLEWRPREVKVAGIIPPVDEGEFAWVRDQRRAAA